MKNKYASAALIIGIIGLFFLSNATSGVGIICLGCLVGILGRINQAEIHHKEIATMLSHVNNSVVDGYDKQ